MRAFMTGAERVEMVAKLAVPCTFVFMLFLLDIVVVPYPLNLFFDAPFFLMGLYYWTVYRPTLLPIWLCFTAGLILDILSGYPLAFSALAFMALRFVLVDQRRFLMAQSFIIFWLGFVVVSLVYCAALWSVMSLKALAFLPIDNLFAPVVLGALIFPLISTFLRLTHKIL